MAKNALPIRVDVVTISTAGASAILVIATLKLVSYHFHQHPLAQAFLLIA